MKENLAFLSTIFFVIFILISSAAEPNTLEKLDQRIFDAIYDKKNSGSTRHTLMKNITYFGDPYAVIGLSLFNVTYGKEKTREMGRLMSSAFLGSSLIVYTSKRLINRRRPLDIHNTDTPALPSGHTANAFVIATILGNRHPQLRIPLYIGAGMVGFSRIYLGRHYLSDVLTGATIGTGVGLLVWRNQSTLLKWEF
ncbi:MAG: phosphatase PAP2 family protein [Candidatus Poribacteria bacterium]|nr:phosphatase PAP2 family protein [Candidatus Poribacteria bacterium]